MATILFIGRFQPFHKGHANVIRWLTTLGYDVTVGVGSSEKQGTVNNPWSFEQRRKMISSSFRGKIVAVPDIPNDIEWVEHVEKIAGKFDGVCTGNRIVADLFQWSGYNVLTPPMLEIDGDVVTGTRIREKMRRNESWDDLVPAGTVEAIRKLQTPSDPSFADRLKIFIRRFVP